jgi:hypothetical protein
MYTKESLAQLGKDASDLYLRHGVPLTDAIVKIASGKGDLSKDHVQRIIENANLVTFEEMFKTGPSKHVTFDLAEPDAVHAKLSGGYEPAGDLAAYLAAPSAERRLDGFDAIPEEKSAAHVPEHVRWRRDYYATKGAVDVLVKEASAHDAHAEAAVHNFVQLCKRASYGVGVKPILQLAGAASTDGEVFTKIAHAVVGALSWEHKEGDYVESLPNRDHPVYKAYAEAESAVKLAAQYRSALINAERAHQRVVTEMS